MISLIEPEDQCIPATISIPRKTLAEFDSTIEKNGYGNRSHVIKQLMTLFLDQLKETTPKCRT